MSKDNETTLVLKNIIKIKDVIDPQAPIDEILKRTDKEFLLRLYKIADFSNSHEFLC